MDYQYSDINSGQQETNEGEVQNNQTQQGGTESDETNKDAVAKTDTKDFYDTYFEAVRKEYNSDEGRLEKEEKRLKRQKLFAAIGDGLSAMHEAYSHSRGVTPVTSPSTSLTGKWRERYDNLVNERKKNNLAFAKTKFDVMTGKSAAEIQRQAARLAADKQKSLDDYNKAKLKIEEKKNKIDEKYKEGLITAQERKDGIAKLNAQANMLKAQAAMTAAKNGRGGVGGYETVTTVERNNRGQETGRRTVRTPTGGNSHSDSDSNDDENTPPSRQKK